jgi:hypothetical protein
VVNELLGMQQYGRDGHYFQIGLMRFAECQFRLFQETYIFLLNVGSFKVTGKVFHILVDKCNLKASFDILMKKVIIMMLEFYILMYI